MTELDDWVTPQAPRDVDDWVTPVAPPPPTLASNISSDWANRQKQAGDVGSDYASGKLNMAGALAKTASTGLGAVSDVVGDAGKAGWNELPDAITKPVEAGAGYVKDKLMATPGGQAASILAPAVKYEAQQLSQEHPNLAAGADLAGNVAKALPVASGIESAGKLVYDAAPSVGAAIKNTPSFVKNMAEDLRTPAGDLTVPQQLNTDLGLSIQKGSGADIHGQIQSGIDNALTKATGDVSGGKPFDPIAATVATADRYHGLKNDVETNLRPALLESGEGVTADASALKEKLQKTVDFLDDNAVPGTSPYAAKKALNGILGKIGEDGTIPFNDLLDMRANVNELYSPGFGSRGKGIIGDFASGIRQMVKDTAESATSNGNMDLADNLREYDQRLTDIGQTYKSDAMQKFVDSDAHDAVKRMSSDGTQLGNDVKANAGKMVDNIKTPTDVDVLRDGMPTDQYNAIRAEKLAQILDAAKDETTGNYDMQKLQSILNTENRFNKQGQLVKALVQDNPVAQKTLNDVRDLSKNLTSRGLEHNPDLAEPGLIQKGAEAATNLANAATLGTAKPIIKGILKRAAGIGGDDTISQYQILKNFARDAYVKPQVAPAIPEAGAPVVGTSPRILNEIPKAPEYIPQVDKPIPQQGLDQSKELWDSYKGNQSATQWEQSYNNLINNGSTHKEAMNALQKIANPNDTGVAYGENAPAKPPEPDNSPELTEIREAKAAASGWDNAVQAYQDAGHTYKEAVSKYGKRPDVSGFKRGGAVQPTEAQKHAGNYKKEHIKIHGLDISIENPKGGVRSGKDKDGKEWSIKMPVAYGYFKRSEGADGDHIDCFIGPNRHSLRVYVIDQKNDDGNFDEHKVMLSFPDRESAIKAYRDSFSDKKNRVMHVRKMLMPQFKEWLKNGDTKKPIKVAA